MTRQEAIAAGAQHYEGHPCWRCCSTIRYTRGKACVNCRLTQYAKDHKSHHRPRAAFHCAPPEKPKDDLPSPTIGAAFPATRARLMAGR